MMEETGVVEDLKANGLAVVRATGGEQCGSCKCQGACQALGGGAERKITAMNQAGATVGDQVVMTIASGSFLKVSVILYLLPVLALVIGSILGQKYSAQIWSSGNPEITSVLTGLFCLVVSFGIIRFVSGHLSQSEKYYPVIQRVIPLSNPSQDEGRHST